LPSHRSRHIDHLDASAVETNFIQEFLNVFNSLTSAQITFQVMTVTLQSTGDDHAVGAVLEGSHRKKHVELARARQLDHLK
jgi:hypothetical protein